MRNRNSYSRIIQNVSYWEKSESSLGKGEIISLLHYCIEQDITSFYYSKKHQTEAAQANLGTALSESGLSRDKIQLMSQYPGNEKEKDLPLFVDDLLQVLKTDYIDLLLIDERTPEEETIDVLKEMYYQGKILEIGGYDLKAIPENFEKIPVTTNVIEKTLPPAEILKDLSAQKLMNLVFNNNIEKGGFLHHITESKVLQLLCEKYNQEKNQILLTWIIQHPANLHSVITTSDKKEIAAANQAKNHELDWSDWQKLNLILS